MTIEIYTHAVDTYLSDIIEVNAQNVSSETRKTIRDKIKKAVYHPERIHHTETEKPPIHIRGNMAVVVGVKEGRDKYVPYNDFRKDNLVVPRVYDSKVFGGPEDDDEGQEAKA